MLLEGEPGIGKSRLVEQMMDQARERGFGCLCGAGNAIESSTPYHAWRTVFASILELRPNADPSTDPNERQAHALSLLLKYLGASPEPAESDVESGAQSHAEALEVLRLAPLLNEVLPLDFPESEISSQMVGQVRADNTRGLLQRLLQGFAQRNPTALALEDAHWMDSASWALAAQVRSLADQSLLLTIVTRPLVDPVPIEYRQLIGSARCERMRLPSLGEPECVQLACRRLGVASLAPSVADFIVRKGQGNPFFSEEPASSLRESGVILLNGTEGGSENTSCRVAPGVDLELVLFPDSVQGVVSERIDRLPPSQQLTLKAASVIGRVFAYRILREIYPATQADEELARLQKYLEALESLDITPLDTPEPNLAYILVQVLEAASTNLRVIPRSFSECRIWLQLPAGDAT